VRLWETATGDQRHELAGNRGPVLGVAFSPDGARLTSISTDETMQVWDPATGELRGELVGTGGQVRGVAFSADGTSLASAGTDGPVQVWDLTWWDRPPADWVEAGCRLVNRNLSMAEWNDVAPGSPYERTCPELGSGEGAPADAPAARYSARG
jgi:WD40 repeat protein